MSIAGKAVVLVYLASTCSFRITPLYCVGPQVVARDTVCKADSVDTSFGTQFTAQDCADEILSRCTYKDEFNFIESNGKCVCLNGPCNRGNSLGRTVYTFGTYRLNVHLFCFSSCLSFVFSYLLTASCLSSFLSHIECPTAAPTVVPTAAPTTGARVK